MTVILYALFVAMVLYYVSRAIARRNRREAAEVLAVRLVAAGGRVSDLYRLVAHISVGDAVHELRGEPREICESQRPGFEAEAGKLVGTTVPVYKMSIGGYVSDHPLFRGSRVFAAVSIGFITFIAAAAFAYDIWEIPIVLELVRLVLGH